MKGELTHLQSLHGVRTVGLTEPQPVRFKNDAPVSCWSRSVVVMAEGTSRASIELFSASNDVREILTAEELAVGFDRALTLKHFGTPGDNANV